MIIIALMGKSGSGKSYNEKLLESMGYTRIVSYTTRDIRDNEENHREYHFVSEEQFDKLIEDNVLIEQATYNGKRYGAPKPVGSMKYVIVVEPDGFKKLKQLYGNQVIGVYLEVDQGEIEARLNTRANTPVEIRQSRIAEDARKFNNIKTIADYSVDGNRSALEVFNDILTCIKDWRNKHEYRD